MKKFISKFKMITTLGALLFAIVLIGSTNLWSQKEVSVITETEVVKKTEIENRVSKNREKRAQIFDKMADTDQYLLIKDNDGLIRYVGIDGQVTSKEALQNRGFATDQFITRGEITTDQKYRDPRIEAFHRTPKEWPQITTPYPDGDRIVYKRSSDIEGGAIWQFDFQTGEVKKLFDFFAYPPENPGGSEPAIVATLPGDMLLITQALPIVDIPGGFVQEYRIYDFASGQSKLLPISGKLTMAEKISPNGKYLIYGVNTTSMYKHEIYGTITDEYYIFNLETWWSTGEGEPKLLTPFGGEIKGWITTTEIWEELSSVKTTLDNSFIKDAKSLNCPDDTCDDNYAGTFYLPWECGIAATATRNGEDCTVSGCGLSDSESPLSSGFAHYNFNEHGGYRATDFSDLYLAGFMHGDGLEYQCGKDGTLYLAGVSSSSAGTRVSIRHNVGDSDIRADDVFSQHYHMQSGSIPTGFVQEVYNPVTGTLVLGTSVSVGDFLGIVGNSGVSDVHIHFDVRKADNMGFALGGASGSFWPRFYESGNNVTPTKNRIYVSENGGLDCNVLDCSDVEIISDGITYNSSSFGGEKKIYTYYSAPYEFNISQNVGLGNSSGTQNAPASWDCYGPEKIFQYNAPPGPFRVTVSNMSEDQDIFIMQIPGNDCSELDPMKHSVGYTGSITTVLLNGDGLHPELVQDISENTHVAHVPLRQNLQGGTFFIIVDGKSEDGATFDISIQQTPIVDVEFDYDPYTGWCGVDVTGQNMANGGHTFSQYCNNESEVHDGQEIIYRFTAYDEMPVVAIAGGDGGGDLSKMRVYIQSLEQVLNTSRPTDCYPDIIHDNKFVVQEIDMGVNFVFVDAVDGYMNTDFDLLIQGTCECADEQEDDDHYDTFAEAMLHEENEVFESMIEDGETEVIAACVENGDEDWYLVKAFCGPVGNMKYIFRLEDGVSNADISIYDSEGVLLEGPSDEVEVCIGANDCVRRLVKVENQGDGGGYTVSGQKYIDTGCEPEAKPHSSISIQKTTLTASANPSSIECPGLHTVLSVSGGIGPYQWINADEGSLVGYGVSIVVYPTQETTYSVVDISNPCTSGDQITISINSTLSISTTNQTIAAGQSTTLEVSASNGNPPYSYLWSGPGLSCYACQSPDLTGSSTTTYTVTVTDTNGCSVNEDLVVTIQSDGGGNGCTNTWDDVSDAKLLLAVPGLNEFHFNNSCATTSMNDDGCNNGFDEPENDVWMAALALSEEMEFRFDHISGSNDLEVEIYIVPVSIYLDNGQQFPSDLSSYHFNCIANGNGYMPEFEISGLEPLGHFVLMRVWEYGNYHVAYSKLTLDDPDWADILENDEYDLQFYSSGLFIGSYTYNESLHFISYEIYFVNFGEDTLEDDFQVDLVISSNQTISSSDQVIHQIKVTDPMPQGQLRVWSGYFSLLNYALLPDESYYLGGILDARNDVIEDGGEDNNKFVFPESFSYGGNSTQLANYYVTDASPAVVYVTPGGQFSAIYEFGNEGGVAGNTSSAARLSVGQSDECGHMNSSIGNFDMGELASGFTGLLGTPTLTVSASASLGRRYLCAEVDRDFVVRETDESDNCDCVEVNIVSELPSADYIAEAVDVDYPESLPGEVNSIEVVTRNIGQLDIDQSSTIRVVLSQDDVLSSGDMVIAHAQFGGLDAGEEYSFTADFTTPCWLGTGDEYYIIARTDYDGDIDESDEENTLVIQLEIDSDYEEAVANISAPSTTCTGNPISLSVPICTNCSYSWSFGDGSTANNRITTHAYVNSGTYTIMVTTSNDCGSETDTHEVLVGSIPEAAISELDDCSDDLGILQASPPGNYTYLWNTGDSGETLGVTQSGLYTVTVTSTTTGCSSSGATAVACGTNTGSSLPVDFMEVVATHTDNGNLVTWKITEYNMIEYVVEKREGFGWTEIQTLPSKASGYEENTYQYTDEYLTSHVHYYRIKGVSVEGNIMYSSVVSVDIQITGKEIEITKETKNLSSGSYIIKFTELYTGDIVLVDILGRKIWKRHLSEENQISVDLEGFPAGVYSLVFRNRTIRLEKVGR